MSARHDEWDDGVKWGLRIACRAVCPRCELMAHPGAAEQGERVERILNGGLWWHVGNGLRSACKASHIRTSAAVHGYQP